MYMVLQQESQSEHRYPLEDTDLEQIMKLSKDGFTLEAIARLLRLEKWVVAVILTLKSN
jgi:hypothetical protein